MKKRMSYPLVQDLLRQGRIARYAGRDTEARVHYNEALAAARSAKDWSMESEALAGLGYTEEPVNPALARDLLRQAIALIELRAKSARVANVRLHLALACLDAGDAGEARQVLEQSLPVVEKAGYEFAIALGLEVMGMILVAEGSRAEALDHFRRAAELRRQPGGQEASPLWWRNRRDAVIGDLLHDLRQPAE